MIVIKKKKSSNSAITAINAKRICTRYQALKKRPDSCVKLLVMIIFI